MQSHALSSGGWFARHHAACSRCRHAFASFRSPATECIASVRERLTGGRPRITVSQRRVPARKRRMCRFQRAMARVFARALIVTESVVVAAVLAVVVEL